MKNVLKFQKKDIELIDMVKNLQKDVKALEDAYTNRFNEMAEAWRHVDRGEAWRHVGTSIELTAEEWNKADKLYSHLWDLSNCVHRWYNSITDTEIDYHMNKMLECQDELEEDMQ